MSDSTFSTPIPTNIVCPFAETSQTENRSTPVDSTELIGQALTDLMARKKGKKISKRTGELRFVDSHTPDNAAWSPAGTSFQSVTSPRAGGAPSESPEVRYIATSTRMRKSEAVDLILWISLVVLAFVLFIALIGAAGRTGTVITITMSNNTNIVTQTQTQTYIVNPDPNMDWQGLIPQRANETTTTDTINIQA